jgi:hypothetical protein
VGLLTVFFLINEYSSSPANIQNNRGTNLTYVFEKVSHTSDSKSISIPDPRRIDRMVGAGTCCRAWRLPLSVELLIRPILKVFSLILQNLTIFLNNLLKFEHIKKYIDTTQINSLI